VKGRADGEVKLVTFKLVASTVSTVNLFLEAKQVHSSNSVSLKILPCVWITITTSADDVLVLY